jgi:hypothetical protein
LAEVGKGYQGVLERMKWVVGGIGCILGMDGLMFPGYNYRDVWGVV